MKKLLFLTWLFPMLAFAQYKITLLDSATFVRDSSVQLSKTSFRGLSVVDDQTIWISGSRGTIARSIDGGKSFTFKRIPGYEKSDFRDIEGFDQNKAIIMSSGTPALILKTTDGGLNWKEVYRNTDTAYFLDAMDFINDTCGMVIGDPINQHFVLIETKNLGETWQELDTLHTPKAAKGESLFAASGTCFRTVNSREYGFVTGGSTSKYYMLYYPDIWSLSNPTYLRSGEPDEGGFSFVKWEDDQERVYAVGGNYQQDTVSDSTFSYLDYQSDGGCIVTLKFKVNNKMQVHGYRSCIEMIIPGKLFITCGTSGVDIGEKQWKQISTESFHVVRKAKHGKAVFLAGGKGRIGKLKY